LNASWSNVPTEKTDEYLLDAFGLADITNKYDASGAKTDRSRPFLVRASGAIQLPRGKYQILLRSLGGARISMDGQVLIKTEVKLPRSGDAEPVPDQAADQLVAGLSLLPPGHREALGSFETDGSPHVFVIEGFVGGKTIRPELGEVFAAISSNGTDYQLLTPGTAAIELLRQPWAAYKTAQRSQIAQLNNDRRRNPAEDNYWNRRHEIARQNAKSSPVVPSHPDGTSPIDAFIREKLDAAGAKATAAIDDASFFGASRSIRSVFCPRHRKSPVSSRTLLRSNA
jgi:hypothetical protein